MVHWLSPYCTVGLLSLFSEPYVVLLLCPPTIQVHRSSRSSLGLVPKSHYLREGFMRKLCPNMIFCVRLFAQLATMLQPVLSSCHCHYMHWIYSNLLLLWYTLTVTTSQHINTTGHSISCPSCQSGAEGLIKWHVWSSAIFIQAHGLITPNR